MPSAEERKMSEDKNISEYLLDTMIIRSLKNGEGEILKQQKGSFHFTASYILPLELLSETQSPISTSANRENRIRKASLIRYYNLIGFENTYWLEEYAMTLKAFGINVPVADYSELSQLILDYINIDDFEIIERRHGDYLSYLRLMDKRAVSDYLEGLKTVQQLGGSKAFTSEAIVDEEKGILIAHAMFSLFTHKHPGIDLSESDYKKFAEEQFDLYSEVVNNLLPKYNNSLDMVLKLWLEYLKRPQTYERRDDKKGNDVFDWRHIIYLKPDKNSYFVTEEKSIHELFEKVVPNKILHKNEMIGSITAK